MGRSIAVVSIATKGYQKYWKEMAQSTLDNLTSEIVMHVATDDESIANGIKLNSRYNQKIVTHKIPSYGWPDATLKRYEIFEKFLNEITEDYICYIDADMKVNKNFFEILSNDLENTEITLISHPGFYRKSGIPRLKLYLSNIDLLIKDLKTILIYGALGSWETNQHSLAFVKRGLRKNYVCGGFWIGKREAIKKLICDLSKQVSIDSENKVIAKWHDESHLNNWAALNSFHLENPRFCFDESYINLDGLENVVTAVRK
jgi:hypothetical protein